MSPRETAVRETSEKPRPTEIPMTILEEAGKRLYAAVGDFVFLTPRGREHVLEDYVRLRHAWDDYTKAVIEARGAALANSLQDGPQ